VNQIVSVCLAINIIYAQAAAPQRHPDAWFGIDKIKHFFMSAFIESVSYSALQAAHVHRRSAMNAAVGITLGAGLGREIHDQRTPGNIFSVRDLTWDVIGAGAGALLLAHTIR
jgi:putative lipoprotein